MKIRTLLVSLALAGLSVAQVSVRAATPPRPADFWATPTVAGYGKMHFDAAAQFRPQPGHRYKVVFALTHPSTSPADVNPALDHVARTVNLYAASGVPLSHLKFVAVAYGAATPAVLDDAHYRARFGVANPNLPLIAALRKAGVTVSVCSQAIAEHDFEDDWIAPGVVLSLSGLTTITTLESEGYALMPL